MKKCARDFFLNIKAISLTFFFFFDKIVFTLKRTGFEVSVTPHHHVITLHGGPRVCCGFSYLHLVGERNNVSHFFFTQSSLHHHKT